LAECIEEKAREKGIDVESLEIDNISTGACICNFSFGGIDNQAFFDVVESACDLLGEKIKKIDKYSDAGYNINVGRFRHWSEYVGNEYEEDFDGQGYTRWIAETGSSALQRASEILYAPRLRAIRFQYSERYGIAPPNGLFEIPGSEDRYRNIPEVQKELEDLKNPSAEIRERRGITEDVLAYQKLQDHKTHCEQYKIGTRTDTTVKGTWEETGHGIKPTTHSLQSIINMGEEDTHNMVRWLQGDDKILVKIQKKGDSPTYIKPNNTPIPFTQKATESDLSYLNRVVDWMAGNVVAVYDMVPDLNKAFASEWYDMAHALAWSMSEKYNLSIGQTSAIIAAISAQCEWNSNLTLAGSIIHIMATYGDQIATESMIDWATGLSEEKKQTMRTTPLKNLNDKFAQKFVYSMFQTGEVEKTQDSFKNFVAGIGLVDQERYAKLKKDMSLSDARLKLQLTTSTGRAIDKAISIYRNGDIENISKLVSSEAKIRDFYNNILTPWSLNEEYTADTHDIRIKFLAAISDNSDLKTAVFGNTGITGRGTLLTSLVMEAGRRATYYINQRDGSMLLPQQVQSITWGGGQGLFGEILKPVGMTADEQFSKHKRDKSVEAEIALGNRRIRGIIQGLVNENAFITDDGGLYSFHRLFHDYLLSHYTYDDYEKEVYRRAGLWLLKQGSQYSSGFTVKFMEKAGCIEEYLSLINHSNQTSPNYYDIEAICKMVSKLPEDYCIIYPFPYLHMVFFMLLSGNRAYMALGRHIQEKMKNYFWGTYGNERITQEEWNIVKGELEVISRVVGFTSDDVSNDSLVEASLFLGGRESEILQPCDPFTFGLPMLCQSEFMSSGGLDAAVERCQNNPYELICNGFGRGSERLIMAEAAILRGNFNNAQIYAKQAIESTEQKSQYFIMASGYYTLMRRALFLGELDNAFSSLDSIRFILPLAEKDIGHRRVTGLMLREVISLSECFYNTALNHKDEIPYAYLNNPSQLFMLAGLGVTQVLSARAMLLTGNAAGCERACLDLNRIPHVCQLARVEALILRALCQKKLYSSSGKNLILKALEEALPDFLVLLFAELPDVLALLPNVESLEGNMKTFVETIIDLAKAYKNTTSQSSVVFSDLSTREKDVLQLLSQGFTIKQIALNLCVSDDTAKKHVQNIYKKLRAHNKTEAIQKARENGLLYPKYSI